MILDAGCGCKCLGDINVDSDDRYPIDQKVDLNKPLPFSEKQFRKVICYHVLEHLENPVATLDELVRVGRLVELRVPHRMGSSAKSDKSHRHFFVPQWFQNYAKHKGLEYKGYVVIDWERFHPLKSPFPLEIRVWLWKNESSREMHNLTR